MKEKRNRIIFYGILFALATALLLILHYKFGILDNRLMWILIVNLAVGLVFIWFLPFYAFQSLLLLLALSTGTYGFKSFATSDMSLLDAFYTTIRLFFLNTDEVVVKNSGWFSTYPLSIEIARWSAALYTASALFALATTLFGQSIKLFWFQLFGKHYVIFGYHKHTKILVRNLRSKKKKVVIVTESISDSEKSYLEDLGVVVLFHDWNDGSRFQKSRLKQAGYYLIFHENDTKNLDELIALKEQFFKNKSMRKFLNLKIHLHLKLQNSYEIFDKYVETLKSENKENDDVPKFLEDYVPVRVVNSYQLIAEKLWNDYPLYKGYEERAQDKNGEPFHLSIIGFGDTGKAIFLESLERAHFLNKSNLKGTILDRDGAKAEMQWNKSYSKVSNIVDTDFYDYDVESELIGLYEAQLRQSTHIIVSLPDDSTNITLGMELSKKYPTKPIYIKIANERSISRWIHINQKEFKNVICFGNWNEVLNYEYFVNEKMDEAAKKVHGNYVRDKGKGVPSEWERLSDFSKESNRKQVSHALTKVILAGYRPVEVLENGSEEVSMEEFYSVIETMLDDLAAIEHERWNAFHYIRGWDTYYDIKENHWKDNNNKLHGCIVPFEKLPGVSGIVRPSKPFEYYDYLTIKELYNTVMNDLGYKIIKDK